MLAQFFFFFYIYKFHTLLRDERMKRVMWVYVTHWKNNHLLPFFKHKAFYFFWCLKYLKSICFLRVFFSHDTT